MQTLFGMYQTIYAAKRMQALREERELNRPGIPKSIERMLSRAERTYTEGLPERDRLEASIRQGSAASVGALERGAVSSTQYMEGVVDTYGMELENLNRIATQEAVFRVGAEERVLGALAAKAGYEHRVDSLKYDEINMDMGLAQGMANAGVQNIWGGTQTVAGAQMEAANNMMRMNELEMMYGKAGATTTTTAPEAPIPKTTPYEDVVRPAPIHYPPETVEYMAEGRKVESVYALPPEYIEMHYRRRRTIT